MTLLIMAAGIGSRYGAGIKQLEKVDANGHIIMDYSIHDALKAGFNRVVFVIRRDIEADFREIIGSRIEPMCAAHGVEVAYAFQELTDIPAGFEVPEGRGKPWGTGHAILAAKGLIDSPFVVINADDYYGKEGFAKLHEFLSAPHKDSELCMAGFIMKNTLSEFGGVTRGVCQADENGYLKDVVETSDIVKTETGAAVNGVPVDADAYVSMNMWGLPASFMGLLESGFVDFFREEAPQNPLKAEYLLPSRIGELVREGTLSVKILETHDRWFGVTFKEDKPAVVASIQDLIRRGEYAEDLFSDL